MFYLNSCDGSLCSWLCNTWLDNGENIMICEICSGRMYARLENECSISKCVYCGHEILNGMGLPCVKNAKIVAAVFSTVTAANSVVREVFNDYVPDAEWDRVYREWQERLHDEVLSND